MTRVRLVVAAASAAVVLGVATTVTLAATGALDGRGPTAPWRAGARCTAPALPGRVVDVTVTDLGSMMGGGPGTGPGRYGTGMMRLLAAPGTVPAGTVSLRVVNAGSLPHEVLVLPLAADGVPGARPAGPDGRVDEAGSLGEASRDCGAGEGDGEEADDGHSQREEGPLSHGGAGRAAAGHFPEEHHAAPTDGPEP